MAEREPLAEGQTICRCDALLKVPTIDLREDIPAITGHLDASDVQPLDPGQGGPDA